MSLTRTALLDSEFLCCVNALHIAIWLDSTTLECPVGWVGCEIPVVLGTNSRSRIAMLNCTLNFDVLLNVCSYFNVALGFILSNTKSFQFLLQILFRIFLTWTIQFARRLDSILVHGQVTIIFIVPVGLSVCLFVCAGFFSAVFDPISIKLGHMLYVWV